MIQVVTIDGPAGAGKSSVARCLARRLGWKLLDTGAMYRAVTLAAINREIDLRSDEELAHLVESIEVVVTNDQVVLNGEDVTLAIRSTQVTQLTRHAADSPSVRQRLIVWQRRFAETEEKVVAEGRDQGTIVFPHAIRKFFLIADDKERAERRRLELSGQGQDVALEEVLRQVRQRDAGDKNRTIAPMVAADDARVVDSTGLSLDQVISILEADLRSCFVIQQKPSDCRESD